MLKQSERLSRIQTGWLLRKGKRFNNDFFSIKFCLNKKPFCRYSVVVSKKVLKLATDRNYLRRQFYEILRQRKATHEGYDYMVFIRPTVLKLNFAAKKEKILTTLDKLNRNNSP